LVCRAPNGVVSAPGSRPASSMDLGGEKYFLKTSEEVSAKDGDDSDDDTTFDTESTSGVNTTTSSLRADAPPLPPKPGAGETPALPPKIQTPPLPAKNSSPAVSRMDAQATAP